MESGSISALPDSSSPPRANLGHTLIAVIVK
jgi:hypothetical protein